MKTLLKLVLILVVGILVYNYFYGNPDEKAQSEQIFEEVKQLGSSVKDLLVDEHQKYKEGKYDDIFNKLESVYTDLESQYKDSVPAQRNRLDSLQNRRDELEQRYDDQIDSTERRGIERELDRLLEDTKRLIEKKGGGN